MAVWLVTLLLASGMPGQVSVDTSLFKGLFGSSQLVFVNGATSGTVVPVVDGVDVVRQRKVNGKTFAIRAMLQPGEPAAVGVRAPHPRTVNVVFKYYDDEGKFVGATVPKTIYVPALPQTIRETLVFAPSQLKTPGGR